MRLATFITTFFLVAPLLADSTITAGLVVSAPSDTGVFLTLTPAAVQELQSNAYGATLKINLVPESNEAVGNVFTAYRVVVSKVSTGEVIPQFVFESPVTLQFGYWTLLSRLTNSNSWTVVQDMKTVLGAYWYNGSQFIRIHELITNPDRSLSLPIHNTGRYEIRGALPVETFRLSQGSPYPRVITPNAATNRRVFFFFENPGTEEVTGRIYDFQGAQVRDLRVDALSPSANCLVWDGRDNNGQVVPTGPYLYKIFSGKNTAAGGLAVAR